MKRKSKYRFGAEWAAAMKTNYRASYAIYKGFDIISGSNLLEVRMDIYHLEHDKWVCKN